MDISESFGWIMLGFVPTLCASEIALKVRVVKKYKVKEVVVAEELVENDNERQQEEEEQEKVMLVKKAIDCITNYNFNNGCLLIFKKIKNVCISKRKIMFD